MLKGEKKMNLHLSKALRGIGKRGFRAGIEKKKLGGDLSEGVLGKGGSAKGKFSQRMKKDPAEGSAGIQQKRGENVLGKKKRGLTKSRKKKALSVWGDPSRRREKWSRSEE